MINAERFSCLAQEGYNRIPVMRVILADLDTPLSAYMKLARGRYSYLFESVQGGEQWGRYSIIGLPARTVLRVRGHQITVERDGEIVEQTTSPDPLGWIDAFQQRFRVPQVEGLPRFTGGLVGYFGYDTVRYIEPKLGPGPQSDPLGCPDILLMVSEEVLVFDNLSGKLYLIVHVDPSGRDAYRYGLARLDALADRLFGSLASVVSVKPRPISEADFVSGYTREWFEGVMTSGG